MSLNSRCRVKSGLVMALVAIGLTPGSGALAEETYKHVLNGHDFTLSYLFPQPFSHTSARLASSFGQSTIPATGQLTQELKVGSFAPRIEGQVNVWGPLAINFGLSGSITSGIDTGSVIQYGASVAYNYLLGLQFEAFREETFSVGFAVDFAKPHSLAFSPLSIALQAGNVLINSSSPDFVSDKVSFQWRPSTRFAWAINSIVGLQSYAALQFSNLNEDNTASQDQNRLEIGLGLDANLRPHAHVPIALTANYLRRQTLSSGLPNSDILSLGLYETANTAFRVGLEIGWVWAGSRSSTVGAVSIRTFYN